MVKAQVLGGGRGKAGGVKLAASASEAAEQACAILRSTLNGHSVAQVLVVQAVRIDEEFYLGAVLDRTNKCVTVMASRQGGVDIEDVARDTPAAIVSTRIDALVGSARGLRFRLDGREPWTPQNPDLPLTSHFCGTRGGISCGTPGRMPQHDLSGNGRSGGCLRPQLARANETGRAPAG